MKDKVKMTMVVVCVIAGIMLTYTFGYFEGCRYIAKGIQLEPIDNSIRIVFENDTEGIWKPVYHNDGTFIGFSIYEINGDFKTFIHINETIKAKLAENLNK